MKKFTFYKQSDAMDCGPTCLKMIFKYYGRNINSNALKNDSQVNKNGVSLLSLSEVAEKYGFRTLSARLTLDQLLSEAPRPSILFWEQYHFVVLTPSSSKKKIVVADPAIGILTYTRKEFEQKWILGSIPLPSLIRGVSIPLPSLIRFDPPCPP